MGILSSTRSVAAILALAVFQVGFTPAAVDEDALTLERRVKAAFLYKFAGYVEWPSRAFSGPDDPLVIAVVGADAVAEELGQVLPGRRIGKRRITVHRFDHNDSPIDAQILFVGRDVDAIRTVELLALTRGRPTLTVTEAAGGWSAGSVINFVIVNDKVRFNISATAAERNGLRLGSQLLAVAHQVKTGPP